MRATGEEIGALRAQQRLLAAMLKRTTGQGGPAAVDKEMWVSMLRAAGVSQDSMNRWHAEFERRAPKEHGEFLTSLGLDGPEVARIRALSAGRSIVSGRGPARPRC